MQFMVYLCIDSHILRNDTCIFTSNIYTHAICSKANKTVLYKKEQFTRSLFSHLVTFFVSRRLIKKTMQQRTTKRISVNVPWERLDGMQDIKKCLRAMPQIVRVPSSYACNLMQYTPKCLHDLTDDSH